MHYVYILESTVVPGYYFIVPPTISASAFANIKATSILTRQNTALGSSKPTWHLSRQRLRFDSSDTSKLARAGLSVNVTSTEIPYSRIALAEKPVPAALYPRGANGRKRVW
jgi:hypothetical protein